MQLPRDNFDVVVTSQILFTASCRYRNELFHNSRGREPMAREPDVALLMTASGSLDIFLT